MSAWFSGSFSAEQPFSGFLDIPSCRLASVFEADDQQAQKPSMATRSGASAAITKCQFLAQVTNLQAFANAS
jgi:hypothetical protein